MQQSASHSEQPIEDVHVTDNMNVLDSEDTDTAHLPKLKTKPDWMKPVLEEDRPTTPELDWVHLTSVPDGRVSPNALDKVDLVNPEGRRIVPNIRKPLPLEGPPGHIESEHEYDISAAYGISHWWFKHKEFYITRHDAPSDHSKVRSHMRILSVFSLKTYVRYVYAFLKEIVLRRGDYKEYKISKDDFKDLHPNDFEDLKRVEDLQLGIESYQIKLNLTQPDWDAYDFLFKEYYTIFSKPRAIIYRDRNDQKKTMREIEVHKFNDGTLNMILEKLDHMVKDFWLFKYNSDMTTRI
uniref:Uncharacterized protein n=1 Tax=Tanacetum cinerariifolium TaxID=118510 RepID=A0A6L2KZ27_TANCI|nr:hypothetical protein [Tanacetum cinerariifolium]